MSAATTARDNISIESAIEQFRYAMQQHGLTVPAQLIADGKIHRFSNSGKRGDSAGWYIYYDGNIPAGAFGCWRSGVNEKWQASIGRSLSTAEKAEYKKKSEDIRRARDAETARRRAEGQAKAKAILSAARPTTGDHPYEVRKKLTACPGIMRGTWQPRGKLDCLLIPMYDSDGLIWNIQAIFPKKIKIDDKERDKDFLYGARQAGLYFLIGQLAGAATILIGEGFATMMSCHMATGLPAVVAFSAGNLKAVAEAFRQKYPDMRIIVCADDDWKTEGNPGTTKANEAARIVGGLLAIPSFKSDRHDKATDFNDMAALYGIEAVKCIITNVTAVTNVQDDHSTDFPVTEDVTADEVNVTSKERIKIPNEGDRPCYLVFDEWVEEAGSKYRPGVWYFAMKAGKGKEPSTPTQQWVCTPLHVDALTYDAQDNNFGRLLRFRNPLKRWREWAMPMELLRGSGEDLRGELLAMGVEIDTNAKGQLADYIQSQHPKRRMRCAQQVGWCEGSFVLPDIVIGAKASGVIFQSGERSHDEYTRAGSLDGWKAGIAARAVGNPMLILALSSSFAGALLEKCNAESGGFHFVGDSSAGKTGLIEAACSGWGGENYKRSWNATANGMEGVASMFNDCLLALDEISQCDPREVGAIVYELGNGRGKQRASRTGNARSIKRWRCFVLSSGERTIETTMAEGGCRTKAGQDTRLPSVPVTRRFGVWDNLHGLGNGAALTDAIKLAAKTHYGHAGRAFLERLTRDQRDFCALLERTKALPMFSTQGGEGQDKRVAGRFALAAMAGELATEYYITGWPEGAAISAAVEGLKAWRATRRGHGNNEKRQILENVSAFIERHGDGRFSNADIVKSDTMQFRDRAGWWRDDEKHERIYLFTSEGMREALKGFDFKRALDVLQDSGALPPSDANGERAKPQRIDGRPVRVYPIYAEKLGAHHES